MDTDYRVRELENNVSASKSLLHDLHRQLESSQNELEREKLTVNIEDVTTQLKDWEYELHRLTTGKE